MLIETQWQETLCFKDSLSYTQLLQSNLLSQYLHQLQTASLELLHPCFSSPALLEHWLSLYLCPAFTQHPAWKGHRFRHFCDIWTLEGLNIPFCKCVWPGSVHSWWCTRQLYLGTPALQNSPKTPNERGLISGSIISLKTKNPPYYH